MKRTAIMIIFFGTLSAFLTNCNNSLSVSGDMKSKTTSIQSFDRLSAKPGEIVTVSGTNLTDDLDVLVNGIPAVFHRIDSKSGTVEMPATMEEGMVRITFSRKSKAIANIPLMNGNSVESMTPTTVPLDSVCDSYIIKTASNDLARGKANCSRQGTLCTQEGQSDCKATENFPAVVKVDLADKIVEGQSMAGVAGTATADCNH